MLRLSSLRRRLFTDPKESQQFYRNSFKQLSDIQQRQVGLLFGMAVADSACRGYEILPDDEVRLRIAASSADDDDRQTSNGDEELAFPSLTHSYAEDGSVLTVSHNNPLVAQSFTGAAMLQTLHVMSAARGEFDVDAIAARWVAVASAHPEEFSEFHGRLLHIIPVLMPMPVTYPFADDDTAWEFCDPFAQFLTEPTLEHSKRLEESRESVKAAASLALSVALRLMQSNPDAITNSALQCRDHPDGGLIFPDYARLFCPSGPSSLELPETLTTAPLGLQSFYSDALVVRQCLSVVKGSRSYAHGIRQVIRALGWSGPRSICAPAMIVGGMLGAKFGVQGIPLDWVSSTREHHGVGTLAIDIAQWSWNPRVSRK